MTDLSLVIEMANAEVMDWDEVSEVFAALRSELRDWSSAHGDAGVELIFVQPGDAGDSKRLRDEIDEHVPGFEQLAGLQFRSVPEGRYYDLKNEGIRIAQGDIVVFLDSDTVPEPGWLNALLAPFADPDLVGVNGFTWLSYDDFLSRVFALHWFFPLQGGDHGKAEKRALNANNCAFRREWIVANPFPYNPGFKVSCSVLWHRILAENIPVARVDARVRHRPPRGLDFFVWRALVSGRDQDRRYALLKSPRRSKRFAHAFSRLLSQTWRALRRTVRHHGDVGIPAWQAPAAFLLWCGFILLTFFGDLSQVMRRSDDAVETIPETVKVS